MAAIMLPLDRLGPASDDRLVQPGNLGTFRQAPITETQGHRVPDEVDQGHLRTELSHPGDRHLGGGHHAHLRSPPNMGAIQPELAEYPRQLPLDLTGIPGGVLSLDREPDLTPT